MRNGNVFLSTLSHQSLKLAHSRSTEGNSKSERFIYIFHSYKKATPVKRGNWNKRRLYHLTIFCCDSCHVQADCAFTSLNFPITALTDMPKSSEGETGASRRKFFSFSLMSDIFNYRWLPITTVWWQWLFVWWHRRPSLSSGDNPCPWSLSRRETTPCQWTAKWSVMV